ncbi:MAG: Nif3-like dinuclear metal center hexameric protein, partial [Clostridia bacterium]|nr:Nif3-like dinuclear metal center hexameric protein [Clostridia bacterium]
RLGNFIGKGGSRLMLQCDVIKVIEEFAPLDTQMSYDHCGLKTGNTNKELTGILICLDLSPEIIAEAVGKNCNLIIEHHPSVWSAWTMIDTKYPKVNALIDATNRGITVYSAHTNIDFAKDGLNDYFAKQIGLNNVKICEEGRIGTLAKETDLFEYADFIGKTIGEKNVKVISGDKKTVKKVACINGAGGGDEETLIRFATETDVFVTSEVKYNVARLSKDLGYAIIEVGHFTSEKGFMSLISGLLKSKIPGVRVFETECAQNPYE